LLADLGGPLPCWPGTGVSEGRGKQNLRLQGRPKKYNGPAAKEGIEVLKGGSVRNASGPEQAPRQGPARYSLVEAGNGRWKILVGAGVFRDEGMGFKGGTTPKRARPEQITFHHLAHVGVAAGNRTALPVIRRAHFLGFNPKRARAGHGLGGLGGTLQGANTGFLPDVVEQGRRRTIPSLYTQVVGFMADFAKSRRPPLCRGNFLGGADRGNKGLFLSVLRRSGGKRLTIYVALGGRGADGGLFLPNYSEGGAAGPAPLIAGSINRRTRTCFALTAGAAEGDLCDFRATHRPGPAPPNKRGGGCVQKNCSMGLQRGRLQGRAFPHPPPLRCRAGAITSKRKALLRPARTKG